MIRNFDPIDRIRRRLGRRDARFGILHELRRRLYRSRDGKVLGVFRGIAESMGFSCFWTRAIGCVILLCLTDFFGAHGLMVTVLVAGFFYLLAALLMQAPRDTASIPASVMGNPPPVPRQSYGGSYQDMAIRPRVDLAQLDQQLDRLDHRIQRMETIVTDRQFDWQRRMDS